ncbi:hypothetical protein E4U14_006886 [Claviceps sp. LM454 group G7]|nr:hypothetical protein E4U14_006886 [Claviceps sp. LM454 group G7]
MTIAKFSVPPVWTLYGQEGAGLAQTFNGKPIPLPEGETPKHIELIRQKLSYLLRHLKGVFSKKASTTSRLGFDVVL